jgi:hypothetical protein
MEDKGLTTSSKGEALLLGPYRPQYWQSLELKDEWSF